MDKLSKQEYQAACDRGRQEEQSFLARRCSTDTDMCVYDDEGMHYMNSGELREYNDSIDQ